MKDLFGEENESGGVPELSGKAVGVLVAALPGRVYDYAVPEGMICAPGDYVCVPLAGRAVPGVVWGGAQADLSRKLKVISMRYDLPPMPKAHRDFIDKVADYTISAPGMVLKMALSVPAALEAEACATGYVLSAEGRFLLVAAAAQVPTPVPALASVCVSARKREEEYVRFLTPLSDAAPRRMAEISRISGCGLGTVKTLIKKGYLEEAAMMASPPCFAPDPGRHGPALSSDQAAAAHALCNDVKAGAFRASLLDGVTGSGKTEVYFEAVAQALKQGRQALILLPEIALSNAFIGRFESRFGCAPALWHSALSPARRRATWRGVARGETKVVVGARSALFLPYADLGLIVVDEEHDPAFKQEEGVFYNARDMAVLRAHMGKIPVVLVSATPSLESVQNAWTGRYAHLALPDRHGGAHLPEVHILDLRADRPESQRFIAPGLRKAIAATLEAGEQVLLFLNRRGYAPLTICRACGHRMECPRCTAWLVEHRARERLECHHCGLAMKIPESCPACHEPESFAPCGPGVERIAEEVRECFPAARTLVLASDTTENPDGLRAALEDVRERRADIVVGTQIVAKGHHFPGLTCVGVIDADLGLAGGELRATERTYQLLHQVAGRAGREDLPGHVWLQTWDPQNRVIQALAAEDRDSFLSVELAERESARMPPFTRLAGIIVSGVSEAETDAAAKALGRAAPQAEGIRTLGPALAPMARLRGRHRRRLLVIADKGLNLQKAVRDWIGAAKIPPSVRVQIDIDPQSFG